MKHFTRTLCYLQASGENLDWLQKIHQAFNRVQCEKLSQISCLAYSCMMFLVRLQNSQGCRDLPAERSLPTDMDQAHAVIGKQGAEFQRARPTSVICFNCLTNRFGQGEQMQQEFTKCESKTTCFYLLRQLRLANSSGNFRHKCHLATGFFCRNLIRVVGQALIWVWVRNLQRQNSWQWMFIHKE